MAYEREVMAVAGGRFFLEDDVEMFEFVIDGGNRIGPRPATSADKANHPALYAAFRAAPNAFNGADASKFDHDGDGEPGGSKPKAKRAPKAAE